MPRNSRVTSTSRGGSDARRREVVGVIGLGIVLFLFIAMVSLQVGALVMGPFGRSAAGRFYGLAGICSYGLIALCAVAAVRALTDHKPAIPPTVAVGSVVGVISLATLIHLIAPNYRLLGYGPGGVIGEHLAEILRALISTAGTVLLATVGLVVALVIATPLRMRDVLLTCWSGIQTVGGALRRAASAFSQFWLDVFRAILPDRATDRDDDIDDNDIVSSNEAATGPTLMFADRTERTERMVSPPEQEAVELTREKKKRSPKRSDAEASAPPASIEAAALAASGAAPKRQRLASGTEAPEPQPTDHAGPVIFEPKFQHTDTATMAAKEKAAEQERLKSFIKIGDGEYQLPSIQLLNYDANESNAIDKTAMLELSAKLTQTLENYGVKGDVVAIRPGPVVTMYEFAPAPGTRVNKIVNLTDDLALALEALRVRIVAPIPGKAAVGIEVPNRAREKVFLKEILADDMFRKGRSKLPLALGKDIEGGPSVVDLARMPHLLVAGTTGSGKSVAVNSMITSLLYHCSPEDVRMIMVDPKMLELSIYEGVPHLLLPVVTDPKKANLALRWAVEEMERRYDLLAQMGVRDIATYNEKTAKRLAKLEADALREAADAAAAALEDDLSKAVSAESPEEADAREKIVTSPPHKLPYIVVVIDEFADLMMCAPKEVETSVARIAQKARAAGIHLILATQRPSVDVITGLIKANFPSRIAFHVTSKIDSRTILDQNGAEALLGAGDMLFSDRGGAPQRLHGCYVDEVEINKVVEFLKTQGRPVYNLDIVKPRDEDGSGEGEFSMSSGKNDDDMYDKAVYIVTTTRNASISWVQRQLRIGYNRAARLVEEMEKQGVVSSPDHTNKREVLVSAA